MPRGLKPSASQVRWQGWDPEGRPLLLIRIAKACEECQDNNAGTVADAVISQVQPLYLTEARHCIATLQGRRRSYCAGARKVVIWPKRSDCSEDGYAAKSCACARMWLSLYTCSSGGALWQVDRAINEMLSDASGPDKIVVVMDARGALAMQATRHVKLFKDVAEGLNLVSHVCGCDPAE